MKADTLPYPNAKVIMKLVLSRKGFDSSYGGIPSPILPDGTLIPLPIPSKHDDQTFSDIEDSYYVHIDELITDLSKGRYTSKTRVHIDPDLCRSQNATPKDWRPSLGQTGNAQSHLRDMNIGKGDVFLFFGWFRKVDLDNGRWSYVKESPDLHVIFGWIEVADVLSVVTKREACLQEHPWISVHPHVIRPMHYSDERNTLYIAESASRYNKNHRHGGGRFNQYSDELRLTKPGCSRSIWSLPSWFYPQTDQKPLSYHPRSDQWQMEGERVTLRSAAKGQEFVLDCNSYHKADEWVNAIVSRNASR